MAEEEIAGICAGLDMPCTVKARVAGALRVATCITLDDVDLNRRPNNAPVEAKLRSALIWATSSGESSIDDVVFMRHFFFAVKHVGHAWILHPRHGVTTGGASALRAENGGVAPEERVGTVHAVPRVAFRDIDAASVAAVHEHGQEA